MAFQEHVEYLGQVAVVLSALRIKLKLQAVGLHPLATQSHSARSAC